MPIRIRSGWPEPGLEPGHAVCGLESLPLLGHLPAEIAAFEFDDAVPGSPQSAGSHRVAHPALAEAEDRARSRQSILMPEDSARTQLLCAGDRALREFRCVAYIEEHLVISRVEVLRPHQIGDSCGESVGGGDIAFNYVDADPNEVTAQVVSGVRAVGQNHERPSIGLRIQHPARMDGRLVPRPEC